MKTGFHLAPLLVSLVLSGCGQKDSASVSAVPAAGPRVVGITATDAMKFSVVTIEARAGEQLQVVLTNAGSQPKDIMGHNWVLLKAGANASAFSMRAVAAKDTDFVPPAFQDQVIARIGTLGPGQSGEVTFTVPAPGEYPFLCSFPAHYTIGMKGTLIVK